MADLTITPANVLKGTGATTIPQYMAGETITAGDAVYLKEADSRWWKTQADGSTAEVVFGGIALHGSLAGQPLVVQNAGEITIGATTAIGILYVVSAAAGKICPSADLVSTNKVTVIGFGKTATVLKMSPILTEVALA